MKYGKVSRHGMAIDRTELSPRSTETSLTNAVLLAGFFSSFLNLP